MRRTAFLVMFLMLLTLIAACGGEKTPQVLVVTATPSPEGGVLVVTTTPSPVVIVVTATPSPESVVLVTATPSQPTLSPDDIATAQAILTAQAANLTATAMTPPTSTPAPPKDTAVPTVKPTAKPTRPAPTKTPASLPPPVLVSPDVDFSCYNIGGCNFTWSWGGSLAANQYFQVQLVGPGNEHRGIHPPTKGYSFHSSNDVFLIITDWCNKDYYCHIKWTVAIIEWDGKDPSKIGRTLKEATPRTITL
jgi:hypothetical protein